MRDEMKILWTLVVTFCICILMGMIGVFFKLVDPQFVEGLISGGLLTLITMLVKDVQGKPPSASTVIPLVLLFLLLCPTAWAKSPKHTTVNNTYVTNTQFNPTAIVLTEPNLFGVKADAPKIVHLFGDFYLGAEGGKDMAYTNTSMGWFAYAKVTYDGTLLDFSKKRD